MTNYTNLYKIISYKFKNEKLLKIALTHPSYANEHSLDKTQNYQRFEFLGDSILQFVTTDYLFNLYPNFLEGELTKHRAAFVCEKNLSTIAKKIELDKYILVGKGEVKEGTSHNSSVLCDVFESLLCAIYLDSNIETVKKFIYKFVLSNPVDDTLDYKTIIQEYFKENGTYLTYQVQKEEGPSHKKVFTVALFLKSDLLGVGKASSKKEAEQNAAKEFFLKNETEIRNVLKIN